MKRPPPKCPEASTVTFPELSYPQVMNLISRHCLPCTYLRFGSGPNHVVVLPEAWDELRTYTHYSKCHPANVIEMQLQGLGHIFVSNGCITVVVSHFIPIPSASASPTHTTIIKSADDLVTLSNRSGLASWGRRSPGGR